MGAQEQGAPAPTPTTRSTSRSTPQLGALILRGSARAFELGSTGVHHPWVLALLCTMSANDWLDYVVERDSSYDDPTTKIGRFTLVALPPLPAEFEQCLGIMGHSAAFVKDDDDAALSALTGTTALAAPLGQPRRGRAGRGFLRAPLCAGRWLFGPECPVYADEKLFAETLPDLDQNSQNTAWEVLHHSARRGRLAGAASSSSASSAAASAASRRGPSRGALRTCGASACAMDRCWIRTTTAATTATIRAPPNPHDTAQDHRRPPPHRKRPPLPGRGVAPSKANAAAASEEEADVLGLGRRCGGRFGRRLLRRRTRRPRRTTTTTRALTRTPAGGDGRRSPRPPRPLPPLPLPPPPPLLHHYDCRRRHGVGAVLLRAHDGACSCQGPMSDPALLTVLAEMARPCCARLKKLKRGLHGVGLTARHHNQLSDDLKLLEDGDLAGGAPRGRAQHRHHPGRHPSRPLPGRRRAAASLGGGAPVRARHASRRVC